MARFQLLLSLFAACLFIACAHAADPKVLFYDDFNSFDLSVWKHEITMSGGGNWEFQVYVNNRTVSYVKDSKLNIKPRLTSDWLGDTTVKSGSLSLYGLETASDCTSAAFYGCERNAQASGNYLNPVMSARLRTADSFAFKYGTVEVRAKLPKGDWLWPAIWLLPKHNAFGDWPASGEIDIMESRGNAPGYPGGGSNTFGSTLHWGPVWNQDPWSLTHADYKGTTDLSTEFHTYGLFWSQDRIVTYIDDIKNVVMNITTKDTDFWTRGGWKSPWQNPWAGSDVNAPFNQEFYLILNVAVGGTSNYFPDGQGGKPWANASPRSANDFLNAQGQWYPSWTAAGDNLAMQVDWVKVTSL